MLGGRPDELRVETLSGWRTADLQRRDPAARVQRPADQVFRGSGRLGLDSRDYDLTIDYERIAAAAAAVPTPARARLTRAWNALRGSAARRGWTEAPPEARRVQWHGYWDGEIPEVAGSR